jgi:hypothetical protein
MFLFYYELVYHDALIVGELAPSTVCQPKPKILHARLYSADLPWDALKSKRSLRLCCIEITPDAFTWTTPETLACLINQVSSLPATSQVALYSGFQKPNNWSVMFPDAR